MFTVKIESYGDILLYFCVWFIWPRSMSTNLKNMAPINEYKLDKYGLCVNWYKLDKYCLSQWVIVVEKMTLNNVLE